MKESREVLVLLLGLQVLLFPTPPPPFNSMSAAQAASMDLKQHIKQVGSKGVPATATGHKGKKREAEYEKEEEESPTAAPYAEPSQSEGEGLEDQEPSEEDEDVFANEFALEKTSATSGTTKALPKLPPKMQASLEKIHRDVLETLPEGLSQCLGCRAF